MAVAPLAKTGRDTDLLVPRPGKAEGPLADSGRSFVPNLRWCRSPATFLLSVHFVCILFYVLIGLYMYVRCNSFRPTVVDLRVQRAWIDLR